MIFVFGSNLRGIHGAGAAREAREKWGAVDGEGEGAHGNSYAIPTKDYDIKSSLSLEAIQFFIERFIWYATKHSEEYFFITRVGCGLAGYTDDQIAPLFLDVPDNCHVPAGWIPYIEAARRNRIRI